MLKRGASFGRLFLIGAFLSLFLFGLMIAWTTTSMDTVIRMLFSLIIWSVLGGLAFSYMFYTYPQPPGAASPKVIANKSRFWIAISGVLILSLLSVRYPHQYTLADHLLLQVGVTPIWRPLHSSTVYMAGLLIVFFFVACLSNLIHSLHRLRVAAAVLALLFISSFPSIMVDLIQKHAANGIYAIQFDTRKAMAVCQWDFTTNEGNGSCVIQGTNESSQPVTAKIILLAPDSTNRDTIHPNITLQNVVFEPHQRSRAIQIHLTPNDQKQAAVSNLTTMSASYDSMLLTADGQVRRLYDLSSRPLFQESSKQHKGMEKD